MRSLTALTVSSLIALGPALTSAQAEPFQPTCATGETDAVDPVALYGTSELQFEIARKGQKIGTHQVRFREQGSLLEVEAHTQIEVKILFVPVYSYDYVSREAWCGGSLSHIHSTIVENGSHTETQADNPGYATNHWNVAAVESAALFNTMTGRHNEIEVERSEERLALGETSLPVTRVDVSGELAYSAWYDSEGRWLQLRFLDKGGVPVELTCLNCTPQPSDLSRAS